MWKSLETTVLTPRRCPDARLPRVGRLLPSTSTQVEAPAGYISSTLGAKTRSTPSTSSSAQSASKVRGYLARSSLGPNWVGFTKMITVVISQVTSTLLTSERCPACARPWSAPGRATCPQAKCAAGRLNFMLIGDEFARLSDRDAERMTASLPLFSSSRASRSSLARW